MAQYSTCQFFIILTQCAMMIIRYQLSVTHSRLSLRLFYLSAHRWRSIFISDAAFMFFSNSFCWKAPIQGPSRPQSREQQRKIKKKPWEVFFSVCEIIHQLPRCVFTIHLLVQVFYLHIPLLFHLGLFPLSIPANMGERQSLTFC